MSTEEGQNRCVRGFTRMWTNLRNFFTRLSLYYNRRRRVRMEHDGDSVTLVRISNVTTQGVPNSNWRDTLLERNRVPPRKRYHHDRSPDTLLQIKIALEEQEIKGMIAEASQERILKPETATMESGENIQGGKDNKLKILKLGDEAILNDEDSTDKPW
ncbi:uncharacterized protein [Rhodnius prolixus]|uniref:uncharacterized protein n=1 Tax=Rhodnius prolixus TaxID=13249 RepID=UPI003D18E10B